MKSVHSQLVFVVALAFFSTALFTTQVSATALTPDRLEITRTRGMSTHITAHEMVTQLRPVQDLYSDMLSLPPAATDQICPQFIIANYKLTFFAGALVLQKANVLKGECEPVTLGSDDIRTADGKFWKLMSKALVAGLSIPVSVGGSSSSSSKVTGSK